jgi:hypothetical protein
MDNQRKHPRRYYSEPKECLYRKNDDQPWETTQMLNLSLGGAKLKPAVNIVKGNAFQLKLSLTKEVIISCVAVHLEEDSLGLSFGIFDEDVTSVISEEINNDADDYAASLID